MIFFLVSVLNRIIRISSRKHAYIVLTPLNPTFIQENWGLQRYTLFFLFLLKNIDCGYSLEPPRRGGSDCGYSLEPPRRGGSNEYHNLCFEQKYEKYQNFYVKIFFFFFSGKIFSILE